MRAKVTTIVLSALGIVLIAAVLFLGLVGINTTVQAGTQVTVCGTTFGVSVSEQKVHLIGVSEQSYGAGDRVRLNAMCVATVANIENADVDPEHDGGGAEVQLNWKLW